MSKREQVAQAFVELFEGRIGSYALRGMKPDGKKYYLPARDHDGKDEPFTPEVCTKHLNGEISIGSYPLDQNDEVKWASMDFDGKKGDSFKDAVVVKKNLEKIGIISWLEISQSGKGTHLWVFFDKKISARKVRSILSQQIPEYSLPIEKRTSSFDRLFPHQDTAYGSYGNLCALPLNGEKLVKDGKTAFVSPEGELVKDQSSLVLEILNNRNKADYISTLFEKQPVKFTKPTRSLPVLQTIPGGTKLMAPQGCAWLRKAFKEGANLGEPEWYAALGQFAKVDQGEILAHKFSEAYPNYNPKETQSKFEHAKEANKPMSCATVWEKFGDCGKRCGHLGVNHPWELAKVPLQKMEEGNKGKIYDAKILADTALALTKEIASGKKLGFAWGYDILDDHTELRPRNFVVVAARQGMGKTAVMIDATVLGALRNIPQYVFSIEMGYEELSLRYLARLSGVDHSLIMTGKIGKSEWEAINKAYDVYHKLPIHIDDSTRELDRMLDNAGELVYKHGNGPIWIDYLQMVRKKNGESQKDAVDRVVDGYKQMSKIIDVPVVALAQLNRTEESTESEEDLDGWLKDSGNIEQTADVIHYIRGDRGPGVIYRRWRLHKERHRASGFNFRFKFNQGIFKFDAEGFWNKQSIMEGDEVVEDFNNRLNL